MKLDDLNKATHAHFKANGVPFTLDELLEHEKKMHDSPVAKAMRSHEYVEFSGGTYLAKVTFERPERKA